ncbi:winged helix-turn-helix transcriptional regulator [Atopomonas sediminilitoris]|uniref:winged helix-turn-helix transcriptional regulator n=1 Tax=Atopomonas sediminilitoris TaxID=2919919 RepID=UPI001F4DC86F|nr:helix-turn-helix domain-containing protein [Atopomonas sediminilitoris]MCJ8169190.1 helix-turn-helix transcriptional regulator [Atopomonas sediminilitoris]
MSAKESLSAESGNTVNTDKQLVGADKTYSSPVEVTLEVVGGKWKSLLVYHLMDQPLRFSELRRQVPGITEKMLTQQLRELERDGIVSRTVFAEVPPRVEYVATEHGRTLKPVLNAMCNWGREHWQQSQPTEG